MKPLERRRIVAECLAAAFVSGPWDPESMAERARAVVDEWRPWIGVVAFDIANAYAVGPLREDAIARAILAHPSAFPSREEARSDRLGPPDVPRVIRPTLEGQAARAPVGHLAELDLPPWRGLDDVAEALGVHPVRLRWFTEQRPRELNVRHLHYVHRWEPKAIGGHRLLEAPRPFLKAAQRRLLELAIARIPPNDAAHGFVPGRSTVTFARMHTGARVVVRMDLADFFSSVRRSRVFAIFSHAGFVENVARLLTRLVTVRTPDAVLRLAPREGDVSRLAARWRTIAALREAHLPQGAPTSPALANLAAAGLDRRLGAAAASFGARYTRYADDLAFSGEAHFEGALGAFLTLATQIVRDEGFETRPDKTRVMRRSARQRIAGIVVNEGVTVARADVERLEAILFNCVKHGLASQNRANHTEFLAHLRGRVAHVAHVDPHRARRVVSLLASLDASQ